MFNLSSDITEGIGFMSDKSVKNITDYGNDFHCSPAKNTEDIYCNIMDMLSLEGDPSRNLATYTQTNIDYHSRMLIINTLNKNAVNKSDYKSIAEFEEECVGIIASLWNIQKEDDYYGISTVGSSEACMLAAITMLLNWRKNAIDKGVDINTKKPNIIVTSGAHICWNKFACYFGVELRQIPINDSLLSINPYKAYEAIDDYTIGVIAVLGTTYTGSYDDVEKLDAFIENYNLNNNSSISIHVDAASGGFYAPFLQQELNWDFRLKNVNSINGSGHKYGLAYASIGWIIWRDKKFIPDRFGFEIDYLGGNMVHFGINFSKSASPIVVQYYKFKQLGFEGYKAIHSKTKRLADYILDQVKSIKELKLVITSIDLPIVCWSISNQESVKWDLYDLALELQKIGSWYVATYALPVNLSHIVIHRVVCRADLSMELAKDFVSDLKRAIFILNKRGKEEPQVSL